MLTVFSGAAGIDFPMTATGGLAPAKAPTGASQAALTALSPRVVKSAHEFEAAMMKELLAPLEAGHDPLLGGDEDEGSGSTGALGSFASEALGQAISEHGGFGIADRILKQLGGAAVSHGRAGNRNGKTSVPLIRDGKLQMAGSE